MTDKKKRKIVRISTSKLQTKEKNGDGAGNAKF